MHLLSIEHVQLAMPPGEEQAAREFYSGILEIPEVEKPPHLQERGGVWFHSDSLKIHLGVEDDFRPARKAHPAILVSDLSNWIYKLKKHRVDVIHDQPLHGFHRVYISDPFGNRIELMEKTSVTED